MEDFPMAKVGPLQIGDGILDAIRDDRLVIFAGAGVSMGSPANLPNFTKLALDIAKGTSITMLKDEPIDRFLGRLDHQKITIHQLAAQRLSSPKGSPTALHLDLLRLFRSVDRVRIVTTNFDLHFEDAAISVFGEVPDTYRAPALPLGRSFRGLIHIHGALTNPLEMVLTDADFGRGYLTEGWARRFLVDVFKTYTVLFVGYSHDDVVMNYLARALPTDGATRRYALSEKEDDWNRLGVIPIIFNKGTEQDYYQELYDGVRLLADRATRGALDWKSQLAQIGSGLPPADEETIGEIKQALREVHTTRFLLEATRHPEWPKWLNTNKKLDTLFDVARLNEIDRLLANWLAEHYVIEHANLIIGIVASKNMGLNPYFWQEIGRALGSDDKKLIDDNTLSRWITILLTCAPRYADSHILECLATRCANQGKFQLLLKIFLFMASCRLSVKPGFDWPGEQSESKSARFDVQTLSQVEHYNLNEVWNNNIKPNLANITQPLLSGIVRRLKEIHDVLRAWDKAGHDWDGDSYRRSAIEPHEQDQYPEPIDVLIDAARDALEWLAINKPKLLEAWIEQFIDSDVPLLRRLAIHAHTVHNNKTADDQLGWMLARIDFHAFPEHHEVYRATALVYPMVSSSIRRDLIEKIVSKQFPAVENFSSAERTARAHFDWLRWLSQTDPSCILIQDALSPIQLAYPKWLPIEHLDMSHWSAPVSFGLQSPWTVDELLAKSPKDQIENLLNFKGERIFGLERGGLLSAVQETCKQNKEWAFELSDIISARALWDSDLWTPMLRGLREADLTLEDWSHLLNEFGFNELYTAHANDIANLLYSLVRDGGKNFALELLDQANNLAFNLWQSLSREGEEVTISDWISTAINHPAGVLVEFWISGLSLLVREKVGGELTLPENYREWFNLVILDNTFVGGLGLSLMASQMAFLFSLDKDWTSEQIIPLFTSPDPRKFAQTWGGFLVWGQLNPYLIEVLQPAFLAALPRLDFELANHRRRFIEFFTALAVFHVNDPTPDMLPALFKNGSPEDRSNFASQLGFFIKQMDDSTRQGVWDRWLRSYWENRLAAIPAPLDEAEAKNMLGWLPHLAKLYPQGVALAIKMPLSGIEHSDLSYKMQKSDLVTQFPNDTAELLIYLCSRLEGYRASYIGTIAKRLQSLDPELRCRLDESMAIAGISKT